MLSSKQEALKNYLMHRLGFRSDDYSESYIEQLAKIARIYYRLAAIPEYELDKDKQLPYYSELKTYNADGYPIGTGYYVPNYFGVVDVLLLEYKFKKNISFQIITKKSEYLSATDLANYTFCPVNYSISKSYVQIENSLARQGSYFHDRKFLDIKDIKLFEDKLSREVDESERKVPEYLTSLNKTFFDDLATSELIYSGHTDEEERKYFINESKRFVGQPDYVFKNKHEQYFVVEEKSKVSKEGSRNIFADSHRVQLAAYIHYLKEWNIQYGYLVNWHYERDSNGYIHLESCYVLKIDRERKIEEFLDKLIFKINDFERSKNLSVDINKLNPKKCASCVQMMVCGHKTRRYNEVTLPYGTSYFKLFYAPYPEILKKPDSAEPPHMPQV